jgi:hypothetical protein
LFRLVVQKKEVEDETNLFNLIFVMGLDKTESSIQLSVIQLFGLVELSFIVYFSKPMSMEKCATARLWLILVDLRLLICELVSVFVN